MTRRWLVTGCSSGLGLALAQAVAQAGDRVVVTARRPEMLAALVEAWPDQVSAVALDLRDAEQCKEAVDAAVERLGGVDVLVNNAGSGLYGAVEEVGDDELRDQMETLVVGPWRLIRLVLPLMRAQGSGHIVNVSSLAGRMPVPGLAAYITGKHALEGMSQSLAAEVAPFGIRVTVLEPGGYATRYGTTLTEVRTRIPAYDPDGQALGMYRGMGDNPELGRPEEYAQTVLRILAAEQPAPLRVPIGPGADEWLRAFQQATMEELDAARALTNPPRAAEPEPTSESKTTPEPESEPTSTSTTEPTPTTTTTTTSEAKPQADTLVIDA
jgi:NAD(P)-dependent dehydrogenase (short-subunit alcohol dehydrogenase family)